MPFDFFFFVSCSPLCSRLLVCSSSVFDGPGPVVLLTARTAGVTVSVGLRPYSGKYSEKASAISGLVGRLRPKVF